MVHKREITKIYIKCLNQKQELNKIYIGENITLIIFFEIYVRVIPQIGVIIDMEQNN
jgi:hypothetical protein